MIRDLINDYDTVIFDQFGQMVMNATTAASIDQVHNDDGSITFTVKINEGLTYNNGEPITAADYVAYALVAYSPVTTEAGAKISAESVVGAAAYQAGETKELAAFACSIPIPTPSRSPGEGQLLLRNDLRISGTSVSAAVRR